MKREPDFRISIGSCIQTFSSDGLLHCPGGLSCASAWSLICSFNPESLTIPKCTTCDTSYLPCNRALHGAEWLQRVSDMMCRCMRGCRSRSWRQQPQPTQPWCQPIASLMTWMLLWRCASCFCSGRMQCCTQHLGKRYHLPAHCRTSTHFMIFWCHAYGSAMCPSTTLPCHFRLSHTV